jgi:AhpD family alkylhydroperoxidase
VARIATTQDFGAVAERIRQRRGGALRPLDLMLLHSPELADGWNSLLGAIRDRIGLAGDIRELVIMRIAVLNRAPYEWAAHAAHARREGLTEAQLAALRTEKVAEEVPVQDLTDRQRAVIAYTDAMTRDVQVPAPVFDALRQHFTEVELVELTATVAAYNMVSRFLVALDVEVPAAVAP